MSESSPQFRRALTRKQRFFTLLLGAGIVVVFGIAVWLKPDPRGFGTHQQLGLPPCTFRSLTGTNCPHCGLTTSFSWFVMRAVVQINQGQSCRCNSGRCRPDCVDLEYRCQFSRKVCDHLRTGTRSVGRIRNLGAAVHCYLALQTLSEPNLIGWPLKWRTRL